MGGRDRSGGKKRWGKDEGKEREDKEKEREEKSKEKKRNYIEDISEDGGMTGKRGVG